MTTMNNFCNCGNKAEHVSIHSWKGQPLYGFICETCRQECDYTFCEACQFYHNDGEKHVEWCPKRLEKGSDASYWEERREKRHKQELKRRGWGDTL